MMKSRNSREDFVECEVVANPEDVRDSKSVIIDTPDGPAIADWARIDRLHFWVLFRSIDRARSARKLTKLSVKRHNRYKDRTEDVEIIGYEPLGANDMMYLLAIVSIAAQGKKLTANSQNDDALSLRKDLNLLNYDDTAYSMYASTTLNQVLRVSRYASGGENIRNLKDSLKRLLSVVFRIKTTYNDGSTDEYGFNLLSYRLSTNKDGTDGSLTIALNPRMAYAIVGDAHHINIDLIDTCSLLQANSRILFVKLCTWINAGDTKQISAEKLCEYLWPDPCTDSSLMAKRRSSMNKALLALETLNWKISHKGRGNSKIYTITRPKSSAREQR